MGDVLTPTDVAKRLKTTRHTIWRWCKEGRIPAFRIGQHWRIDEDDLNKVIEREKKKYAWRYRYRNSNRDSKDSKGSNDGR